MRKAIICFLEKEDKVLLLLTEYKDKTVWNGVSGYIEEGETDLDAAIREVEEEIGVKINKEDLIKRGEYEIFTIFSINKWEGTPLPGESSIKELRWFDKNNLPYSQMHEGNEKWLAGLMA